MPGSWRGRRGLNELHAASAFKLHDRSSGRNQHPVEAAERKFGSAGAECASARGDDEEAEPFAGEGGFAADVELFHPEAVGDAPVEEHAAERFSATFRRTRPHEEPSSHLVDRVGGEVEHRQREIDIAPHEAGFLRQDAAVALEFEPDDEIGRLHDFDHEDPLADGVGQSAGNQEEVARPDRNPVETAEHRVDVLGFDHAAELLLRRRPLESEVDGGVGAGPGAEDAVPLGLAGIGVEKPLRKLHCRMALQLKPDCRIEILHQHARMVAEPSAMRFAEQELRCAGEKFGERNGFIPEPDGGDPFRCAAGIDRGGVGEQPLLRKVAVLRRFDSRDLVERAAAEVAPPHPVAAEPQERRQRALQALRDVDLPNAEEVYQKYPHQMSGGMLQRAMIAAAIISRPKLLLADEPTTALDVTIQAQILELLRRLNREMGMSILFISHNLNVVRKLCTRVAVMEKGLIVETGDTQQVFYDPRADYTRRLIAAIPTRKKLCEKRY